MNTNASPIQWYPGHMAKARRMMQENLGMVDVLCEILDARIVLAAGKPRVIVLGRADLAEPKRTDEWKQWYEGQGYAVLACDSRSRRGIAGFSPMVRKLLEEKISEWNRKGQSGRKIRLMAVGIPNVGKSTFINSLAGRKTESRHRRGQARRDAGKAVDQRGQRDGAAGYPGHSLAEV